MTLTGTDSLPDFPFRVLKAAGRLAILCLLWVPAPVLAAPDAYIEFVDQWVPDDGRWRASYPHSITWDWDGNLLVGAGGGSTIMRCTTSGECERFMNRGHRKILIDEEQRIILSVMATNKIVICDSSGSCPDGFGEFGIEPGQFHNPMGLAIDTRGRLVVADRLNNRVQFCDLDGLCTTTSGNESIGRFKEPASLLVDGKGNLYVGELGDEYVHICHEDGTCSGRLGEEGQGVGQFKTPIALQLSSRGDLVILELSNHRIQVCDLNGSCFAYGSEGGGPGQFLAPGDMVLDENDRIYVADIDNDRVQVLQLNYNTPPPEPEHEIGAGHAGAWFWPTTTGQGQFIDVEPESQYMFIGWFTYTEAGSDHPNELQWYTAQGKYSGNSAELGLYESLGGKFRDPQVVSTNKVGTVTLEFDDCQNGTMSYQLDEGGPVGTIPLERVVPGSANLCQEAEGSSTQAVGINHGMDGAWFDPNTSGQGFFFDVHATAEGERYIFVSWFTYGEDTASGQRWLTAQGTFEGSAAAIDVYETSGGSFDDPQAVEVVKAGTMTIDFADCATAELSYTLDEGLEGTIDITRVVPGGQALCEVLDPQD